jgi:hypothetical protein
MEASYSFMTAGPTFRFELPGGFDPVPELSSPIYNGNGVRDFDFLPPTRDNGVTNNELLAVLEDGNGHNAEFYVWPWDPPQWYLRWILTLGDLYTHLRDEDGPTMAEATVRALTITEDGTGGTPYLLLQDPLKPGIGARPEYRETATFFSSDGGTFVFSFRRPGFLSLGDIVSASGPDAVQLRRGLPFGLELFVRVIDLPTGQKLAETIAASLHEG